MDPNSDDQRQWIFPERNPGSAIVLAPSKAPDASITVRNLLTTVSEMRTAVLVVWFPCHEGVWLEQWPDMIGGQLNNAATIAVVPPDSAPATPSGSTRETVDIDDLEGLESRITCFFEQSAERDTQPILLFDSLSVLARRVGSPSIHDLIAHLSSVGDQTGAQAYFHVDRAHRTLAQDLRSYADVVAERPLNGEQGWDIS